MTTKRPTNPTEPSSERRELARIVRRIQTLALELQELQRREADTPAVNAKERRLDQLRWQLAAVARRTATEGLGNAA
jgi:hypothetical protein